MWSKQLQKSVALHIYRTVHFHGFDSSGDAKNNLTDGSVLSVCVLLIYIPVIPSFLPSQSETTKAYIIIGRAQCICVVKKTN